MLVTWVLVSSIGCIMAPCKPGIKRFDSATNSVLARSDALCSVLAAPRPKYIASLLLAEVPSFFKQRVHSTKTKPAEQQSVYFLICTVNALTC